MTVHSLYQLEAGAKVAGVTVKGVGTVQYTESTQTVAPKGDGARRRQQTSVVGFEERLTFVFENMKPTDVPRGGTHGESKFTGASLGAGTARTAAAVTGTAAKSTVDSVDMTIGSNGEPAVRVVVFVESADGEAAGMVFTEPA